jgi:mannose-6-phosphate isomerase-like protein (cupin superfamily)
MADVISISDKFKLFTEQWSPKIIAQMNDNHFKIVKIQGEFIWHAHPDTDEVFLVIDGELRMEFRDRSVKVTFGEMIVVPAGVEHKPVAERECQILMIEKAGTVNVGEVKESEQKPSQGEWI